MNCGSSMKSNTEAVMSSRTARATSQRLAPLTVLTLMNLSGNLRAKDRSNTIRIRPTTSRPSSSFIDFENDLVSKESLKHALENLSRQVRQCDEVTIYLVGHGNVTDGELVAISFENHEFVTQAEFSDWLDDIRCEQMSIFLDFCYS